jgi:membrane fusion protein, multidrug efflux system
MRKGPSFIIIGLCIMAACCAALLGACKRQAVGKIQENVLNVQAEDVLKKPLRPFIEAIGTLNPNEEVIVSAEVEGILKSVLIDEGTPVSRGKVLATIDDTNYASELRRDDAARKQAEANLANTKVEHGRKEALYKEELVTQQQFDDVCTRLTLAEAELARMKAFRSITEEKLRKTKVDAPLAGAVQEKKVSAGDFVKIGTPLFVLIQSNPIKLRFTVPEKDVGRIRLNQDVSLKVDGFPDREFAGRVAIIYPAVEERTRSLTVEALVPNQDGILKPGLFAKVMLYTGPERDTVVVPITGLLYEQDKVKVFAIEGDRAKERPVRIGRKYGEFMEIVEGLQGGERIAVTGQQNLSDGAKVMIQSAVAATAGPSSPAVGSSGKKGGTADAIRSP